MSEINFVLPVKIDGIYDIQPPTVPGLSYTELGLITISSILLTSIFVYMFWKYFFSRKNRNIRKIKSLLKSTVLNEIDARKTVYQLCGYLKQGLNIKQIDITTQLPLELANQQENHYRWNSFTRQLSDIRYKSEVSSDIKKIINESLYWLKKWPGKDRD